MDVREMPYDKFVGALLASPESVKLNVEVMNRDEVDLLHAAVGIATEAGELLDAMKKSAFYGHKLDWENVLEELGDILFYLTAAKSVVSKRMPGRDIQAENRIKLSKRYPSGSFSSADARARADKA